MKLTRSRVIALIVVFACYGAGSSALLTGEFNLESSSTSVHLEGFAAYIAGFLFIGVGTLAAASLFRR